MSWITLLLCLGMCLGVGALGGRWTGPQIAGWYAELKRPSFAPPNWVFGPVWTLLYILMAIAAWRVLLAAPSELRTVGLGLFIGQLALNLAWSWIFFRRHALGAALADVILLWLAIGGTTILFCKIEPRAGWLMSPYWAWVTFATVLNADFLRLNGSGSA